MDLLYTMKCQFNPTGTLSTSRSGRKALLEFTCDLIIQLLEISSVNGVSEIENESYSQLKWPKYEQSKSKIDGTKQTLKHTEGSLMCLM